MDYFANRNNCKQKIWIQVWYRTLVSTTVTHYQMVKTIYSSREKVNRFPYDLTIWYLIVEIKSCDFRKCIDLDGVFRKCVNVDDIQKSC